MASTENLARSKNVEKAGLRVQRTLAKKNLLAAWGEVRKSRKSLEKETGYPVIIKFESTPDESGWGGSSLAAKERAHHLVWCDFGVPRTDKVYMVALEIDRLRLKWQSMKAGKARTMVKTDLTYLIMAADHFPAQDLLPERYTPHFEILLEILYNLPACLFVQRRIRDEVPILCSSQFVAMTRHLSELPDPATAVSEFSHSDPRLIHMLLALDSVQAKFCDSLFPGMSDFARKYLDIEYASLPTKLWACWQ